MERNRRRQPGSKSKAVDFEEVSSVVWENIVMSEQEEDLIYRMHKLVGDRWGLIAGRIPEKTAEQVERFWIMRHNEGFAFAWGRKEAKRAKYGAFTG
ncbi:hypothetical protein SAY87_017492 [Trapa incisa]|uniref:Myb-like domain-containing protein n=2 Tax=Trapa TaxID=22665 RepID=A0AAN7LB64_TRANT|nr:hypothetical protein SAY87_017492 [Trapa incisa]KAK4784558.1 hypothetical protein SAY86_018926 [Trapa natans]